VAVLDLVMPRLNGIETAREIMAHCPGTRVVILTMHTADCYLVESLKSGINAYVLKANAATELASPLYAVCRGETYVSCSMAQAGLQIER
jgi:DNA-binding NarL/FixJ family response regulator